MHRRYWLFMWNTNNPCGGFHDFYGSFNTEKEAKDFFEKCFFRSFQIFDSVNKRIVDSV